MAKKQEFQPSHSIKGCLGEVIVYLAVLVRLNTKFLIKNRNYTNNSWSNREEIQWHSMVESANAQINVE